MNKRLLKHDKHRLATGFRVWLPEEIESLKAHISERPRKSIKWLAIFYRRHERSIERMIERIEKESSDTGSLSWMKLK